MPSLWFVVPAHGRVELARICLRQLRRTCDALGPLGVQASAVVVADDENLETAAELGFATVRRSNRFLSAKFNDGIQLALDEKYNPRPADYVVPCGSDDWIDHRILVDLPTPEQILAFRLAAFVSEDGSQLVGRQITYEAGVGIRVYPREIMAATGYRPADEDRERACDTSILVNTKTALAKQGRTAEIVYGDRHEFQIVDWKTRGEQLNSFGEITARFGRGTKPATPHMALAETFPAEALLEMRRHYARANRDALVAA